MKTSSNIGLNIPEGNDVFDYKKFLADNLTKLDDHFMKIPASQEFIATEGQTVFNLASSYTMGANVLSVEVDGVPQELGTGFTETSPTSITLAEGVPAGATISVTTFNLPAGVNTQLADIQTSLAEKATVVPLSKFLLATESVQTLAIRRAFDYCKTNKKSLFIEDGTYILDEKITFDAVDFLVHCQSNNTIFKIKHNDYAFQIAADRSKFIGGQIIPFDATYNNVFKGINVISSLCLIDNVLIINANEGIKFSVNAWVSVAKNMYIQYVHKGIIFANGSGGCEVNLLLLDGDAGYESPSANGSVGVSFESGAGYSSITGDGQISSFHFVMDVQGKTEKIKLGELYIEHCLQFYTTSSKGIVDVSRTHISLMGTNAHLSSSNIINVTSNGINKSDRYIDAKDSAIPINNLLGYFLFAKSNLWKDETNQTTVTNPSQLIQSVECNNLWGKSFQLKSKLDWNPPLLDTPSKPKQISFVVSLRRDEITTAIDPTRLLQIQDPASGLGVLLTIGEAFSMINQPDASKQVQIYANNTANDFNNCIGFCMDITNNLLYGYSPQVAPVVLSTDLSSLITPTYKISFINSGTSTVGLAMNYLAIFEGILTYEQFLNIYRSTTPLVKKWA